MANKTLVLIDDSTLEVVTSHEVSPLSNSLIPTEFAVLDQLSLQFIIPVLAKVAAGFSGVELANTVLTSATPYNEFFTLMGWSVGEDVEQVDIDLANTSIRAHLDVIAAQIGVIPSALTVTALLTELTTKAGGLTDTSGLAPIPVAADMTAQHNQNLITDGSARQVITLPDDTAGLPFYAVRFSYDAATYDKADAMSPTGNKTAQIVVPAGFDPLFGAYQTYTAWYDEPFTLYRADGETAWRVSGPAYLADDPTLVPMELPNFGTTFPANATPGFRFYRTDLNDAFRWDPVRQKWLGESPDYLDFGRNNSTSTGSFFRRINGMLFTATRGVVFPYDVTVVGYTIASDSGVTGNMIVTADGATVSSIPMGNNAAVAVDDLDDDITALARVGVRNNSGASVNNTQGTVKFRRVAV